MAQALAVVFKIPTESPQLARGVVGRARPVNDSWIAACCLAHGLPLATFNMKDFADFAGNDGLALIGTKD
jgi:predicted nucleic acid-binding protein